MPRHPRCPIPLRWQRLRLDLTARTLAVDVGCSYQHLHDIELGKHKASAELRERIAERLGMHPAELFGPTAAYEARFRTTPARVAS